MHNNMKLHSVVFNYSIQYSTIKWLQYFGTCVNVYNSNITSRLINTDGGLA